MAKLVREYFIYLVDAPLIYYGQGCRIFVSCDDYGPSAIARTRKEAIEIADSRCKEWHRAHFRLEDIGFAYAVEAMA